MDVSEQPLSVCNFSEKNIYFKNGNKWLSKVEFKTGDNKYIIYSLEGIKFHNNIVDCYKTFDEKVQNFNVLGGFQYQFQPSEVDFLDLP